jgi:N-dimethylarginine dimethylaminohydrolase
LKSVYEKLEFTVEVLPAKPEFPDLVFCANQTLPFIDPQGRKAVIMSQMHAEERQGEVAHFRTWFQERGYRIHDLTQKGSLEGAGDLIWDYEGRRIFAGYGFRTELRMVEEAREILGVETIPIPLADSRFYHLDTCLSVLGTSTAAYVEEAFTPETRRLIRDSFSTLISIPRNEAERGFAANCHRPAGQGAVIIQRDCPETTRMLREAGLAVHEVDTSEFIKAGGSVFCLKQMVYE